MINFSPRRMLTMVWGLVLVVPLLAAGCGNRGPLFLPEDPPPPEATGQQAGATEDADRQSDDEDGHRG